ncbi:MULTISPECIES: CRISPR-associated protein Cas4 [Archaeoglobus]|jgi:CRISPR-associated exonuclease Cas4|uniref:CRISPR-associated exonuclease Cas4 n=3 Tax=Archaeoglobus fulgidus TaxID=2234 RepID=O30235_ARCFU|nr:MULTISPECIES: CRISPR-associated protein Cas4 [Archaeoglobus]AAB91227.1 conserved hypothetical protein [Archaeoglobus fulgidus DSM 4304]AIG99403.1 RecB family exonuclease [Archaeoglobus fulgidus DSM 8774]KUJ94804.1 MAG: hypothetical protein XD40_0125 [Archaeoglobus fulgidus]KUK06108.1 MAG: hypothetical protein XD48_1642 [Archaeoglobus fulgidus]MDI3498388.1 CRISPR-associated exonuclease Cas4 [Archaeoglobus sp.]
MVVEGELFVRGTEVSYYFVCKTKLWLFSRNIAMEHESDSVKLGKLVHRQHFSRDDKEVRIGRVALDIVRRGEELEVVEVKKSDRMEKADYYQLAYYLYYLSKHGVRARGRISYPKSRKNVSVELDENLLVKLKSILEEIKAIKSSSMPKPEKKSYCTKCAYYELCFS